MSRRPWLAALLSFVVVGLGHVYNGELARGVHLVGWQAACLIAGAVIWAVATAAVHTGPPVVFLLLGLAASPLLYVVGIVGAWRGARRLGDAPAPARSWLVCGLFAILVTGVVSLGAPFVVRSLVVQSYRMPSRSMVPTLAIGDHFVANKLIYGATVRHPETRDVLVRLPGLRRPAAGDVVVFVYPKDRTKDFVKRIVAVAGETVEVRDTSLLVDGKERLEPYARYEGRMQADYGPVRVPDGHLFVLGDNRNESYDSRFWGAVPVENLHGRAEAVFATMREGEVEVAFGPVVR